MPRTETIVRQLYQYEELTDKAKEAAREWYREASAYDEFHEFVYEHAVQCAKILGIEIADKTQNWVNVSTGKKGVHTSPAIFFSGFWSQGDGACFEGRYSFAANAAKLIRDHAPTDTDLHAIADALASLPYGEGWSARMKHTDHHYSHSGCMSVDSEWRGPVADAMGDEITELPDNDLCDGEETIKRAMRDFADWIYRQLEAEYAYQNADEQVDDSIIANEYEFTETGEIA